MEIYLFRHGEIKDAGKFIGKTDSSLTELGKKQNETSYKKCKELDLEIIFRSPLKRTKVPESNIQKELSEMNFGKWEKMSWEEVEKYYPNDAKKYLNDPLNFTFPNGKSYEYFQKRVMNWIKHLSTQNFFKVGIITHQGVMKSILNEYTAESFWDIKISYGEMRYLKI